MTEQKENYFNTVITGDDGETIECNLPKEFWHDIREELPTQYDGVFLYTFNDSGKHIAVWHANNEEPYWLDVNGKRTDVDYWSHSSNPLIWTR